MIRSIGVMAVLLALCAAELHAQPNRPEPSTFTVAVAGLRIVGPPLPGAPDLRPFTHFPGTTLALVVRRTAGTALPIDLDDRTSTTTALTDDLKADLLKRPDGAVAAPGRLRSTGVSDSGTAMLVELHAPTAPTNGSREITAKGVLKVRVAASVKRVVARKVKLKAGAEIVAGGVTYRITKVSVPKWGQYEAAVELETGNDDSAVRSIGFIGKGDEIGSRQVGWQRTGFGADAKIRRTFYLAERPAQIAVVLTLNDKVETVDIPFDLKVGVGGALKD